VPCGFTAGGLPVAMQLVGNKFDDARVLRAARAYEAAHPFRMPKVEATTQPGQPMVVGAAGAA